ncbi:phytanoyl-CoA dioxygenase [Planoprotostelium fungivorum]|uniref:Phytanoyl-CoA dioxygenase n=1 Tax=Planoprotostelium fungivorum TaxID=1890364 RepID=A0A2P6NT75_9EUKA|nr:phytanoyl-CoA dioxygenase [Planoprotostelium fungivorum]
MPRSRMQKQESTASQGNAPRPRQKYTEVTVIDRSPIVDHSTVLLTDQQMSDFIVNGFLVLNTNLPPTFHDKICEKTRSLDTTAKDNNPGNNILPLVPELRQVFETPAVRGALTSVLGRDYIMHAHRYPHVNAPGHPPQKIHRDSYYGYNHLRHHKTRWAMVMYYPADTTLELGPTCIVPTSQYYSCGNMLHRLPSDTLPSEWKAPQAKMVTCPAGSVVLIHYDLWHRGTPNKGNKLRYMFKFQFMRTKMPQQPSWYSQSLEFPATEAVQKAAANYDLTDLWRNVWDWHCGKRYQSTPLTSKQIAEAAKVLYLPGDQNEPVRLIAAYKLGSSGDNESLKILLEALRSADENTYRCAMYGLTARDDDQMIDSVCEILRDEKVDCGPRAAAAFVLSETLRPHDLIVPALLHAATSSNIHLQRSVAEALGTCSKRPEDVEKVLQTLAGLLQIRDDQLQFFSAFSIGQTGSTMTREIAETPQVNEVVKQLDVTSQTNHNRYVRFFTLFALERIPSLEAKDRLIKTLWNARWDDLTTTASAF